MNAAQIPLDLGHRPRLEDEDFLVAEGNEQAYRQVTSWPGWSAPVLVLTGPPGSGKTHLGEIWRRRAQAAAVAMDTLTEETAGAIAISAPALLIDPMPPVFNETALFHLVNHLREAGGHLLIVAEHPASRWPVALPDLRSRLIAAPTIAVASPDEALLRVVLVKLFADRQLRVTPDLVDYLMRRSERSFAGLRLLVDRLDQAAMAVGRAVTPSLAAMVLADLAAIKEG